MTHDIRWKQRFDNLEKAYELLSSVFRERTVQDLSDLEQEGVIQRFEYTYELAWKTLKDYLEYSGIALSSVTPRSVMKSAFEAGILQDAETWVAMIDDRNRMSHTYNRETRRDVYSAIIDQYIPVLEKLLSFYNDKTCVSS